MTRQGVRRALATQGALGAIPWWYDHVRASRLCPAVKPWEWDEHPLGSVWLYRVLVMEGVEEEAARAAKPTSLTAAKEHDLPADSSAPPPPPSGGSSFGP